MLRVLLVRPPGATECPGSGLAVRQEPVAPGNAAHPRIATYPINSGQQCFLALLGWQEAQNRSPQSNQPSSRPRRDHPGADREELLAPVVALALLLQLAGELE